MWSRLCLLCGLLAVTAPAARAQEEAADDTAAAAIVSYPSILEYVEAPYPAQALEAGVEGVVRLLVELDETGAVTYVEVLEPAGNGFDEAATSAVQQMRFTPARTADGPVGVAMPFDYTFTLPEDAAAPPADPDAATADDTDDDVEIGGAERDDAAAEDGEDAPLPIVESPAIIDYVEAPYPPEAEAAGVEGTVVLLVTLDAEGTVEDVAVSEPAGQGFDEAAVEAVRQMTFTPAKTAEGPVGVVFEFAYAFTLEPEEEPPELIDIVTVEGLVRQMGTRKLVDGASVYIPGLDVSAATDTEGRFALKGVPPGQYTLKVRHPDHVELDQDIEVVEGEVTTANLWIRSITYRDNEAVGYYEREKQEVTRRTLTIEEVKRIPGTFGDPVKVVQTLPGAARSPFGTGFLIIRGADPDSSRVYIDGIEVPIIYHLTGTTSVLAPDAIEAVDFLPGGYGVQYGRSLGGVVNVRTKERFDDLKITGGFDVLDAQVWFEGALGKNKNHMLGIGARRSYIDLFIPLFTGNTGFRIQPVYWDYQVKYIPKIGDDQDLSFFVYGFQDVLKISTPGDVAQGTDQNTQGDLATRYQSHRLVVRYQKRWGDRVRFDFLPSIGVDIIDLGLGDDFKIFTQTLAMQIRSEVAVQAAPSVEVALGIDAQGGPYNFDFRSPLGTESFDDPLADRVPIGFGARGSGWYTAPYLKLNIRPLKDRDRWLITPGLRYDNTAIFVAGSITNAGELFGVQDGGETKPTRIDSVDPRLTTRFVAYDKDEMSVTLKGSTGLYHQPPQGFESFALGDTTSLLHERSWNSSLGIEHKVNQAISWDLEGFYRRMDDLITFSNAFGAGSAQPFANEGDGYAAGFEILIRHNPVNRFFGWISYTFSRSFRRDGPGQPYIPFDFDQPHIFSAQGGYNFPFDIGLSLQIQFVSGNPETPLNAGIYDADTGAYNGFAVGQDNSRRQPPFFQTSVRLDKTFTFRKWQLEAYVEVINALRAVNPEATVYNYDFAEFARVRGLPTIPNIGLEFKVFP